MSVLFDKGESTRGVEEKDSIYDLTVYLSNNCKYGFKKDIRNRKYFPILGRKGKY